MERNINIHSTLKAEAVGEFDEFNPNAEAFLFAENHAIPLESSKQQADSKNSKVDKTSDSNPTHAKRDNSVGSV